MKKILACTFLALIFSLTCPVIAQAATGDLVIDEVGVVTAQERESLNTRAQTISTQYECDVAIIVVDEMSVPSDAIESAIQAFYGHEIGSGSDLNGILLFLSMADRDYALIAHGYGNTALTDYGRDVMLKQAILPPLKEDRYNDSFTAFLDKADQYLLQARDGMPFDTNNPDPTYTDDSAIMWRIAVMVLVPLLIALIICQVWKSKMKSARLAKDANRYVAESGLILTAQSDQFLYRTHVRTPIPDSSSSSGGGTTIGSSGFSGSSGKF